MKRSLEFWRARRQDFQELHKRTDGLEGPGGLKIAGPELTAQWQLTRHPSGLEEIDFGVFCHPHSNIPKGEFLSLARSAGGSLPFSRIPEGRMLAAMKQNVAATGKWPFGTGLIPLDASDPVQRWLTAIYKAGLGREGTTSDHVNLREDGTATAEYFSSGFLRRLAESSAALCLELELVAVSDPVEETLTPLKAIENNASRKRGNGCLTSLAAVEKVRRFCDDQGWNKTEATIQFNLSAKTYRKFLKTGTLRASCLTTVAAAMKVKTEDLLSESLPKDSRNIP